MDTHTLSVNSHSLFKNCYEFKFVVQINVEMPSIKIGNLSPPERWVWLIKLSLINSSLGMIFINLPISVYLHVPVKLARKSSALYITGGLSCFVVIWWVLKTIGEAFLAKLHLWLAIYVWLMIKGVCSWLWTYFCSLLCPYARCPWRFIVVWCFSFKKLLDLCWNDNLLCLIVLQISPHFPPFPVTAA